MSVTVDQSKGKLISKSVTKEFSERSVQTWAYRSVADSWEIGRDEIFIVLKPVRIHKQETAGYLQLQQLLQSQVYQLVQVGHYGQAWGQEESALEEG